MTPYWQGDGVTLYLGDAVEVMTGLPDGSVDLICVDPPFESEAHTQQRRIKRATRGSTERSAVVEIGFAPITAQQRELVSDQFGRLARRWCLVFCQHEASHLWKGELDVAGLRYLRRCLWIKTHCTPQLSGDRPAQGDETIVATHVRGRSRWNGGGKSGVYTHAPARREPGGHPTPKPLPLMRELVSDFSDEGELVLDSHMGSGTTLLAAWQLGRQAIGIELDEKWAELAAKRLEAAQAQGRMFRAPPAQQLSLTAAP